MRPGIDFIGVSVSFFCHDGKEFLLHKRSDKCRDERGHWDFGGGRLEIGETLEKAVLREVMEEYGVKGFIEKQLPAHSLLRQEKRTRTHWLIITFIVKVDRSKVVIGVPEKMSELGWFNLNQLPHPMHTGAVYTLKHYPDEFKKYL
ncbi:NUDIX hydrolase [Patescibacteria group bacterium]|nr:NUDIX hydrolase [Patescibacteria group bacterium]